MLQVSAETRETQHCERSLVATPWDRPPRLGVLEYWGGGMNDSNDKNDKNESMGVKVWG